jgi:hypothetical protein
MEFHQWFTFGLHHSQLYVDEPWVRYHVDGRDRVSVSHNRRQLDDHMKFIEEHDEYLRSVDAPFLSELLFGMWLDLLRAGRASDRMRVREYLRIRKVSVAGKLAARLARKAVALTGKRSGKEQEVFFI